MPNLPLKNKFFVFPRKSQSSRRADTEARVQMETSGSREYSCPLMLPISRANSLLDKVTRCRYCSSHCREETDSSSLFSVAATGMVVAFKAAGSTERPGFSNIFQNAAMP